MRRLIIVVLAWLLAACGSTPTDTARQFYEAFERHEYSKAKGYVCPEFYGELDHWIREMGDQPLTVEFDVKYDAPDQSGDRVVVRASGTRRLNDESFPVHYEIQLEKQDGEWKVCDLQVQAVP